MNIILNFNDNRWEHGALLDFAIKLLKNGKKVTWIDCRNYKFALSDYKYSFFLKRFLRFDYLKNILRHISIRYANNFNYVQMKYNNFSNKKQISLNYSLIFNEVISITRDSDPSKIKLNLYRKSMKNVYNNIYEDLLPILKKYKSKECTVYIFNGRFLKEQAADNLCKSLKLKVRYVERFSPQWSDRYFIFNQKIHLSKYRAKLVEKHYKRSLDYRKNEIGKKWFDNRISGTSQNFTKLQNINFRNELSKFPLICFFHSSEDELVLSDLGSESWNNQFEIVKFLFELFINTDFQLIIRVHPNLKNKALIEKWRWKLMLKQFSSPNFKILYSTNKTNSYSLVKASKAVITFGSTIGVEATYLRKKSILLGKALHDDLKVVQILNSKKELLNQIQKIHFKKDFDKKYFQALKYGYFMETAGIKIENLKTTVNHYVQDPIFNFENIMTTDNFIIKFSKSLETKFYKTILNFFDFMSILRFYF